ncbi:MAG: hypothetical protein R3E57_07685 [Porticoccaceae bacterium]
MNEIATNAGVVLVLLGDLGEDLGCDRQQCARVRALETLVAKIGWIADAEALSVGGSQAFGDADRWFMSHAYQEAKEPAPEVRVEDEHGGPPRRWPFSLDDEDTMSARVTQANAIVSAMFHTAIEAAEGGENASVLSWAVVRDNLWAAGDLLRQAEGILMNPSAADPELSALVEPQKETKSRGEPDNAVNDDGGLSARALRKLEDIERDYLSVQQSVSAVRAFADELHDASYQDEPPALFSEFAGVRVQAISRLAQLALNDIERLDMRAREIRGLPDPMDEALRAAG